MALTNRCMKCGGWNRYKYDDVTSFASVTCVDCHHIEKEPVKKFTILYAEDTEPQIIEYVQEVWGAKTYARIDTVDFLEVSEAIEDE